MEEKLLAKIQLAISLGEEPTNEQLTECNMNKTEYNELITLNSMIENSIALEQISINNNEQEIKLQILKTKYLNDYLPQLQKNGLAEFLPNQL